MLSKYCPNPECAQPNYYTLKTPLICSFCGTNLEGATLPKPSVASKTVKPQRLTENSRLVNKLKEKKKQQFLQLRKQRTRAIEDEEIEGIGGDEELEEEDVNFELPDITKLEVEIQGQGIKSSQLTLGQLAEQKKMGFKPRPPENKSTSDVIKEFQQEAKSKSAPIDIEDTE